MDERASGSSEARPELSCGSAQMGWTRLTCQSSIRGRQAKTGHEASRNTAAFFPSREHPDRARRQLGGRLLRRQRRRFRGARLQAGTGCADRAGLLRARSERPRARQSAGVPAAARHVRGSNRRAGRGVLRRRAARARAAAGHRVAARGAARRSSRGADQRRPAARSSSRSSRTCATSTTSFAIGSSFATATRPGKLLDPVVGGHDSAAWVRRYAEEHEARSHALARVRGARPRLAADDRRRHARAPSTPTSRCGALRARRTGRSSTTMSDPSPISIRRTFAGKHVLLTGASGFVGKVWLALMLERAPEIERIYVLLRSKSLVSARARFEKIVNSSPVFRAVARAARAGDVGLHRRQGRSRSTAS